LSAKHGRAEEQILMDRLLWETCSIWPSCECERFPAIIPARHQAVERRVHAASGSEVAAVLTVSASEDRRQLLWTSEGPAER
jgi:hypothetical protein